MEVVARRACPVGVGCFLQRKVTCKVGGLFIGSRRVSACSFSVRSYGVHWSFSLFGWIWHRIASAKKEGPPLFSECFLNHEDRQRGHYKTLRNNSAFALWFSSATIDFWVEFNTYKPSPQRCHRQALPSKSANKLSGKPVFKFETCLLPFTWQFRKGQFLAKRKSAGLQPCNIIQVITLDNLKVLLVQGAFFNVIKMHK